MKEIGPKMKTDNRGTASRMKGYKDTYKTTRDHRMAIRTYVSGNRWATENARAVGNI